MTSPPEDPRIPDLVTLTGASAILGIGRAMTHRLVKQGQLRGKLVDGIWVFRKTVVEKLRDQRA